MEQIVAEPRMNHPHIHGLGTKFGKDRTDELWQWRHYKQNSDEEGVEEVVLKHTVDCDQCDYPPHFNMLIYLYLATWSLILSKKWPRAADTPRLNEKSRWNTSNGL